MLRVRWIAVAAVVLLQTQVARADSRADALARQASARYQAGDYEGAVAALLKGYELSPDPRFLFNIARAYEKAGDTAEAARFYHRYLEAKDTEPAVVQKAREALDVLEPKPPPPPPVTAPPVSVPPAPAPATIPPPTASAPPPAPKPASLPEPPPVPPEPSYTVPYVVMGAGIAAVLAGAGVGIWANSTASQVRDSLDPVQKPELRSEALSRATAADITMGAGAVLVLTGLVWRLTSHPASPVVRMGLTGSSCTFALAWVR
jgi:outer membrane biosynthesis protein TonB